MKHPTIKFTAPLRQSGTAQGRNMGTRSKFSLDVPSKTALGETWGPNREQQTQLAVAALQAAIAQAMNAGAPAGAVKQALVRLYDRWTE